MLIQGTHQKDFTKGVHSPSRTQGRILLCLFLVFCLTVGSLGFPVIASEDIDARAEAAAHATSAFLIKQIPNPTIAMTGGDWAVFALARSGEPLPAGYMDRYYQNVIHTLQQKGGVLHDKKYTEYSRVILALTAIGKDVTNVGGYNLLEKLADYDRVVWQGINGPVFALLALDAGNYELPKVFDPSSQATRERFLQTILSQEITAADGTVGGFALSGKVPDIDITAMVLQALAPYRAQQEVAAVIDRGLTVLSKLPADEDWRKSTCESAAQTVVALTALGIDPARDKRFIQRGISPLDGLLQFSLPGGGFAHLQGGKANGMATEQALYSLAAFLRFRRGDDGLYNMSAIAAKPTKPSQDLSNKVGLSQASSADLATFQAAAVMKGCEAITTPVQISANGGDGFVQFQLPLENSQSARDIATAAALNVDGTLRPVPSKVVTVDGKKVLQLIAISSGIYGGVSHSTIPSDIDGHWAETEIKRMTARMILPTGTDGKFHPSQPLTRGEFTAAIAAALGLPPQGTNQFTDVLATDQNAGAIGAAVAHGLIRGTTQTTFAPAAAITRQDAATIFMRMAKTMGISAPTPGPTEIETQLAHFTDRNRCGTWALEGLAFNVKNGFLGGDESGRLNPTSNMTRAELAVILNRILSGAGWIS